MVLTARTVVRLARTVVLCAAIPAATCNRAAPASEAEPGPVPPPASPSAGFDPWQNARERGIDFRAVGQEPGWYVEVDHEKGIRLVYDYAEQQAVMASPVQPITRDGTLMYEAASDTHRLEIAIEAAPCEDTMSGAPYPNTVTVNIDGRALRGCGRPLP